VHGDERVKPLLSATCPRRVGRGDRVHGYDERQTVRCFGSLDLTVCDRAILLAQGHDLVPLACGIVWRSERLQLSRHPIADGPPGGEEGADLG